MKKILILCSAKAGGSHRSLAQALASELKKKYQVQIYDYFLRFGASGYFYIHHYLPQVYNFFYRLTDNRFGADLLHLLAFPATWPSLKKINWQNYDLVISVQHFLTSEISWSTRKPLVIFIADPVNAHQVWMCSQADLTLTATQAAADLCLKKGLLPQRVKLVGFPVRPEFWQKKKKHSRQFTVFLGGSGYGLTETKAILNHLQRKPLGVNLRIIVVCGRNPRLEKSLRKNPQLEVYGFVENIAELMTQADLIVGKAGSGLLFESIALAVPFLATGYPPEQEKGNLELIKKQKIGFVEPNPKKAARLILALAQNPSRLQHLHPNLHRLANQHQPALANIRREIDRLIEP